MVLSLPMAKGTTTRTLFINRLKREGRGAEWRRRYKEAKKECDGWKEASDKVMAQMGFVSAAVEREIHERFLKYGMAGIPEQLESIQQDKEQTELIEILGEYDINDSELPADIAFVFHNLHKAVGEMTNWKTKPDDAPTPGAWNMLIWASANQTKFFDKVLGEQLKSGRTTEDQGMRDTQESVEQIEAMLSELL